MVQDVAYDIRGKIIVLCGKVAVHTYQHPDWRPDDPLLVFNMWRGHAFLYTPEAHKLAGRLPIMRDITTSRTNDIRIRQSHKDDDLTKTYSSMLKLQLPLREGGICKTQLKGQEEITYESFHSLLEATPGAVF